MNSLKLLLIILLLFPLSANASSNGIIVDCPKEVKEDEEFSCLIKGNSDFEVSWIEYNFAIDDNLEYISFDIDTSWEGAIDDYLVLLYTDENKIGNFNIGKLTLKSKNKIVEPNIETLQLSFGDQDFNERIIVKENVNNMKSEEEKSIRFENNYFKYVIIVLIIGGICIFCILYKKRRK